MTADSTNDEPVNGDAPSSLSASKKAVDGKGLKLEKSINLFSGITIIVGSIIGSGIFVSPTGVLVNCGSVGLSLVVWVMCGVFSLFGAYCYAELGTMITKSGGDYAYVFEAFGPFYAFLRMWVECLVIKPTLTAIQGLTFATYVVEPFFQDCEKPTMAINLLAVVSIMLLTFANCRSVRLAARIQDISTIAKTFALVVIIITGIVRLAQGYTLNFAQPFTKSIDNEVSVGTVALATYSGLFAYIGWNYLNMVMEEFQKPERNLPIAIFVAVITCTVLYTLTNVAYFTSVTPAEMVSSSAVAVTFANKLYGPAAFLMPIFVALSCAGGMNGNLLTTSRIFFVSAREGHLPQIMAGVSTKYVTPLPAVFIMGLMSCFYVAIGDVFTLINYTSFVQWFAIGLSVAALLYFRRKLPEAHRPLKISLFWPITYMIMTVFICAVPLITAPVEVGFGILIVCTGIPVYLIFVKWQPKALTDWGAKSTRFLQKLFLIYPDTEKMD